jgi:hypothetical protein
VAVATEKLALADPAGTVKLVGTLATDELVLVRVTVAPPVGAAAVRFTVPCDVLPPVTVVGLSVTDDSAAAFGTIISVVFAVEP